MHADVIIIGAGLSGLACAIAAREKGLEPLVLEAGDGIGGRMRTDRRDGYLLDRGFQVLQTWYPEARRFLDYPRLDLRPSPCATGAHRTGRPPTPPDVGRKAVGYRPGARAPAG